MGDHRKLPICQGHDLGKYKLWESCCLVVGQAPGPAVGVSGISKLGQQVEGILLYSQRQSKALHRDHANLESHHSSPGYSPRD